VRVSRRVELRNGAPTRNAAGLRKTRPLQAGALRYLGADMVVLLENDIVGRGVRAVCMGEWHQQGRRSDRCLECADVASFFRKSPSPSIVLHVWCTQ
jgi:hypothetical protein